MATVIGGYDMAQEDGGLPTTLVAGSAPGESGVSVLDVRFHGGAHVNGTTDQHLVWFLLSRVRIDCRIAGRPLLHDAPAGSLAICPAGADAGADADGSLDALVVAIEPSHLALAAAEGSSLEARLMDRLTGDDQTLLGFARTLVRESAGSYPNGSLFWHEAASGFIDSLIAGHTLEPQSRARGTLGKDVLKRIREHVLAHIDEPIEVATLARMAGRTPFHFSRVFARSVGVTPHRYVVHLRLQRAIELVREGQSGLVEIAARTGFADQSHLSRWVRRVHGVSLTQIAA